MERVRRLVRHVRTSVHIELPEEESGSTLESFFAGVRWREDRLPDGRTTLRRASM